GGGDRRRAAAHHRAAAGHGAAARGAAPAQKLGEDRQGADPGNGAQPGERALAPAKLTAIRPAARAVPEVPPGPAVGTHAAPVGGGDVAAHLDAGAVAGL